MEDGGLEEETCLCEFEDVGGSIRLKSDLGRMTLREEKR